MLPKLLSLVLGSVQRWELRFAPPDPVHTLGCSCLEPHEIFYQFLLDTVLSGHSSRTLALIRLLTDMTLKKNKTKTSIFFFFKGLKRGNGNRAFIRILYESEEEWRGRGFERTYVFV